MTRRLSLSGTSLVWLALPLMALAGCGNSRTPVPSLTSPVLPAGVRSLSFPAAGVKLKAPRNWQVTGGRGHLVTVVSSGQAVAALWRYPRSAMASGGASLRQVQRSLIGVARKRDPNLELISARITRMGGVPAVQLDALEQIAGQVRQVSSSHLFARGSEVVLDQYAPPRMFASVDRSVFRPMRRSLMVGAPAHNR